MQKLLQICIKTPDELATKKKKYSSGNNMSFRNKTIKETFMMRSRLRNIYLKNGSDKFVNTIDRETIVYLFYEK